MASQAAAEGQGQAFIGPGLSPLKRNITILAVACIIIVVLAIAIRQGSGAIGSTIVAMLLIIGFILFLRMIAPVPFTITLEPEAIVKRSTNGELIEVRWEDLTRVKEEFFPNGKRISVIVYRKPATPEQKTKAWAVYRDDVTDIDSLAAALKQAIPATCEWKSETVHD
jgi:hypothetical protein